MVSTAVIRELRIRGTSEGLDKLATDLDRVAAGQTKVAASAAGAAVATETSARRQLSAANALRTLEGRIDGVTRANRVAEAQERTLQRAIDQGLVTREKAAQLTQRIEANRTIAVGQAQMRERMNAAAATANDNDRNRFGLRRDQVGNLAYQGSDLVSQLGSGAPVSQILLQQGPQVAQILAEAEGGIKGVAAGFAGLVNPITAVGTAVVALGAGLAYFGSRGERALAPLEDRLKGQISLVNELSRAYGGAGLETEKLGQRSKSALEFQNDQELRDTRAQLAFGASEILQKVAPTEYVPNLEGGGEYLTTTKYPQMQKAIESLRDSAATGEPDIKSFDAALIDLGKASSDVQFQRFVNELSAGNQELIKAQSILHQTNPEVERLARLARVANAADAFKSFVPNDRTARQEIESGYALRVRAISDLERSGGAGRREADSMQLAAQNDLAKALGEVARREGDVRAEQDLRLRSIGALTVAQRAQIEAERAMIGANAPDANRATFVTAAEVARAEVYRQAVSDAAEAERQAVTARSQVGLDGYAASLAEINARFAEQIRLMDGSTEATARLTRARELEIETLQVRQRKQLFDPQQDSLRSLSARADTIGLSDDAGRRVLAVREAENALLRDGIDLNSAIGRGYIANASRLSDYGDAIRRQAGAWDDVRRAGEDAIDGVFERLSAGDLKGAMKGIADDLSKTVLQLGVTNPLKNSLLGTSYGTLSDLTAGRPAAPSLDMPNFPSVATATIEVGVANFTGAAFAGIGPDTPIERRPLPALNDNAKGDRIVDPSSARVSAGFDATSGAGSLTGSFTPAQLAFFKSIQPGVMQAAASTGVDPRIIAAQAAHESNWGRSAPGNNLFGIKARAGEASQMLMTSEVLDGRTVRLRQPFRTYDSLADSVEGYGDFINKNPRYGAFRSARGLDAQLDALGRSGYATDPSYRQKIGSIAGRFDGGGMPDVSAATSQLTTATQSIATTAQTASTGIGQALNGTLVGGIETIANQAVPGLGSAIGGIINAFQQAGQASGGGSSLLSLLGFADGGYTGAGGVHQPAGVVHRGEIVWSQRDIARAGGVGAVEGMRLGMRGYADGGHVGDRLRMPANANLPAAPRTSGANVKIIDMRGSGAPAIEQRETQDENGQPQFEMVIRDIARDEMTTPSRRGNRKLRADNGLTRQVLQR